MQRDVGPKLIQSLRLLLAFFVFLSSSIVNSLELLQELSLWFQGVNRVLPKFYLCVLEFTTNQYTQQQKQNQEFCE